MGDSHIGTYRIGRNPVLDADVIIDFAKARCTLGGRDARAQELPGHRADRARPSALFRLKTVPALLGGRCSRQTRIRAHARSGARRPICTRRAVRGSNGSLQHSAQRKLLCIHRRRRLAAPRRSSTRRRCLPAGVRPATTRSRCHVASRCMGSTQRSFKSIKPAASGALRLGTRAQWGAGRLHGIGAFTGYFSAQRALKAESSWRSGARPLL